MKKRPDNRVSTGVVRLSFVHLDQPYSFDGGEDKKYQTMVLVDKNDKKTLETIERAIQAVRMSDRGKLALKGAPKNVTFLRDGDEEEKGPEFEGHYFFNTKSNDKPLLIDKDRQEIVDPREIYSGCYAQVSFDVFAYNTRGNKGISTALRAVRKIRDGEPLGGFSPVDPDSEFDDVDDDDDFFN